MRALTLSFISGICLFLVCGNSAAQVGGSDQFVESYVARLSERDHFNSQGQRLRSPAAIIRQDRANFYVYDYRDAEDEPDTFFSNKANRALLERLLDNGYTAPGARRRVVDGTPLVRVEIYTHYVTVTILSE